MNIYVRASRSCNTSPASRHLKHADRSKEEFESTIGFQLSCGFDVRSERTTCSEAWPHNTYKLCGPSSRL